MLTGCSLDRTVGRQMFRSQSTGKMYLFKFLEKFDGRFYLMVSSSAVTLGHLCLDFQAPSLFE